MTNLILYELPGCPYCAKVVNKLEELGLEYESRKVPGSRSERSEVKEVSGQFGVPVLIDEEHGIDGMPESDDIVAHLEANYAQ